MWSHPSTRQASHRTRSMKEQPFGAEGNQAENNGDGGQSQEGQVPWGARHHQHRLRAQALPSGKDTGREERWKFPAGSEPGGQHHGASAPASGSEGLLAEGFGENHQEPKDALGGHDRKPNPGPACGPRRRSAPLANPVGMGQVRRESQRENCGAGVKTRGASRPPRICFSW